MKISLKSFVVGFLLVAGVFQFTTNSILGPQIGFIPADGNWYPAENSPIGWKSKLSSIIHPIKFILVEPLTFLGQDPDSAPPVILFFYALYWTAIATALYYAIFFFRKLLARKNT